MNDEGRITNLEQRILCNQCIGEAVRVGLNDVTADQIAPSVFDGVVVHKFGERQHQQLFACFIKADTVLELIHVRFVDLLAENNRKTTSSAKAR